MPKVAHQIIVIPSAKARIYNIKNTTYGTYSFSVPRIGNGHP